MDAFVCPKGHSSSERDYCSECGAKISTGLGQGPSAAIQLPSGASAPQNCPECGAPHEQADAVFCDVCGFNFVTGVHGGAGVLSAEAPAASAAAADEVEPVHLAEVEAAPEPVDQAPVDEASAAVAAITSWTITLSVDPTLKDAGSPDAPVGVDPVVIAMEKPVNLIGRRSEVRAIFPEVPISYDDAVSHRHALLQLDDAGVLRLRDIGATNGTRINGVEIKPMTDETLKDGDEITLGHWSRISVKAAR